MIKIEKNIQLKKLSSWPLDKMEVGDSFLVPCEYNEINSLRATLSRKYKGSNYKFSTRVVKEGLRIWRTK